MSGSGNAGRLRLMVKCHRLVARSELDDTFWTDRTVRAKSSDGMLSSDSLGSVPWRRWSWGSEMYVAWSSSLRRRLRIAGLGVLDDGVGDFPEGALQKVRFILHSSHLAHRGLCFSTSLLLQSLLNLTVWPNG